MSDVITRPLISILQDIDKDANVRVVIRSYDWEDVVHVPGAVKEFTGFPGQFVVTVEVRDPKRGGAWGVIPGNLKRYNDAFEALSWATIALEKSVRQRSMNLSVGKLQPFQRDDP